MIQSSKLTHLFKSLPIIAALLLKPSVAFSDAGLICAGKIMEAGTEVSLRSVEVTALANGLLRYSWSSEEIECDTIDDQIINLTIKGKKVLENGFSSADAAALFKYMESENSKMFAECKERFDGAKETFTSIYLPKLQSLDANVEDIKNQFDENFSKVSREFFIKKYYEHKELLARLETYEELLRNGNANPINTEECISVADKASTREEDFRRRIERLETQVAQRDEVLSQQATEIKKFREELQKLEGIKAGLSAELALYEKPRKLKLINDFLKSADFVEATELYKEIISKFTLTLIEQKRLETIAAESVRPIPASDRESNRNGYQFLVNLFPDNRYYQKKLASYLD